MLHFLTLFKFLFNFVNNLLIRYPLPKNIGYMWNTFFFFMIAFVIQLFTGLFLAMFYFNYILYMFLNIIKKRIYINYLEMNLILFYYIYNILWCALVSWATLNKLEQKLKLGFVYYLLSYAQTINNTTSEWFSMFQTFYTPHFFSIFLHERKYEIPLRYKHSSFKYNNNSLSKRYYSMSNDSYSLLCSIPTDSLMYGFHRLECGFTSYSSLKDSLINQLLEEYRLEYSGNFSFSKKGDYYTIYLDNLFYNHLHVFHYEKHIYNKSNYYVFYFLDSDNITPFNWDDTHYLYFFFYTREISFNSMLEIESKECLLEKKLYYNAHFNFSNYITQSKFQLNKKKSICSKRCYSTSHFNKWHNKIIIKKNVPNFLKGFYYNFFYYYYFRLKYSLYVSSISYQRDFVYLNTDEDVYNPYTTTFYSNFMKYDSLDEYKKLSFVNTYLDYLLESRRNWLVSSYRAPKEIPLFNYKSMIDSNYHAFVFKYPNGIFFFSSWMYFLETDVFKFVYKDRCVNVIYSFYTCSYKLFYYYPSCSTYNFEISCSFTYDSKLNDLNSKNDLITLIRDFISSKYDTSKSNRFRYPLYKLLSSLELDHTKIHFNFSNVDIRYDNNYTNKYKGLFKRPKVVRKYSTLLSNTNRRNKNAFHSICARYMWTLLFFLSLTFFS